MSTSQTIIAALKFQGGVIIAADTQASDIVAQVRWPCEKLDCIGTYPCVIGFSGGIGRGQRARAAIEGTPLYPNMFERKERIRNTWDRCLRPIYKEIREENVKGALPYLNQDLWGLAVYWAEDEAHILEYPINGDSEFCPDFRVIGSAANTAHAIYQTLGGNRLTILDERRALPAMLRILSTSIEVEQQYVSEPLRAWTVSNKGAKKISEDEIETHKESVYHWLERERSVLFGPTTPTS